MRGRVKLWIAEKGYGFIVPDDGSQDVFIHASELPTEHQMLPPDSMVEFDLTPGANGRMQATAISVLKLGDPSNAPAPRPRPAASPPKPAREPLWSATRRAGLADSLAVDLTRIADGSQTGTPEELTVRVEAARLLFEALNADANGG